MMVMMLTKMVAIESQADKRRQLHSDIDGEDDDGDGIPMMMTMTTIMTAMVMVMMVTTIANDDEGHC